jgi:hypothetical protein
MQRLIDSVETSVNIKLFKNKKDSSYDHIFNSELVMFKISDCDNLENFNPPRLSQDPFPVENRPRGQKNLNSVIYHRDVIKSTGQVEPVWIALKDGEYTLLDGVHRIVATFLEGKSEFPAYIVKVSKANNNTGGSRKKKN